MTAQDIMLLAPNTLKGATYVTNDVSDDMIGPAIREAQEEHLITIIGSNLLNRLQELVLNKIQGDADTIDDAENLPYKYLLDCYVVPFLQEMTQSLLCVPITFKTRNMGVIQNSDVNVNKNFMQDVARVQQRYKTSAMRRATALSMYLCANRKLFPELDATDCGCRAYVRPLLGRRLVNLPLNLNGPHKPCCK